MPDPPAATDSDSTATSWTPTEPVVVVFKSEAEHVGDSADIEGIGTAADEASMGDKPVTTSVEEEDDEAGGTVRTGGGSMMDAWG